MIKLGITTKGLTEAGFCIHGKLGARASSVPTYNCVGLVSALLGAKASSVPSSWNGQLGAIPREAMLGAKGQLGAFFLHG